MRSTVEQLVRQIDPLDDLEREHQQATLEWIASGAELFRIAKPAAPPQHLVSYFVVVDPSVSQLLLVDHKNAGLWLPTGGHVEPGEHPKATVEREVREELGIDAAFLLDDPLFLTVTETVGHTAGHRDVSLWFVLLGDAAQDLDYDRGEFHAIRWFDLDALPLDRCDAHLHRFAMKLEQHLLGAFRAPG